MTKNIIVRLSCWVICSPQRFSDGHPIVEEPLVLLEHNGLMSYGLVACGVLENPMVAEIIESVDDVS